jgi:hypothetical protein
MTDFVVTRNSTPEFIDSFTQRHPNLTASTEGDNTFWTGSPEDVQAMFDDVSALGYFAEITLS